MRLGDAAAATGRVILAHPGNGESLAAVRDGMSIDTSLAFMPTSGLPMSTRSGDLDPGLVSYLARTEHMSAAMIARSVLRFLNLGSIRKVSRHARHHPVARPA